jgi:hypothetical protein
MTMGDSNRTNEPQRWPLQWAAGYFISHDGVVTRADGRPLKDIPLAEARQRARRDISHDPVRMSASGVTHGRGGTESLVFVEDGTRMAAFVVLKPKDAREAMESDGAVATWLAGHAHPAVGDIERGWYFVRGDDEGWRVFHGRSYAARVCGAVQ